MDDGKQPVKKVEQLVMVAGASSSKYAVTLIGTLDIQTFGHGDLSAITITAYYHHSGLISAMSAVLLITDLLKED